MVRRHVQERDRWLHSARMRWLGSYLLACAGTYRVPLFNYGVIRNDGTPRIATRNRHCEPPNSEQK